MILAITLIFNGQFYELESFDYDYVNNIMTITAKSDLIFKGGFEDA